MRLILFSIIFVTLPNSAFAWYRGCGPEAISTLVGQNIDQVTGTCTLVPLQLKHVWSENGQVDAWEGGYNLAVSMSTTYRIDFYDRCSGSWVGSKNRIQSGAETLMFNVINPNLKPGLPSYEANAPLTDAEAQAALPDALTSCQKVQPGPWLSGN